MSVYIVNAKRFPYNFQVNFCKPCFLHFWQGASFKGTHIEYVKYTFFVVRKLSGFSLDASQYFVKLSHKCFLNSQDLQ